MIHLVVCPGRRVRDPKTKKLVGPQGVKIEEISTYWFRRLQDGDVKIASSALTIPEIEEQAPAPKKSKSKGD